MSNTENPFSEPDDVDLGGGLSGTPRANSFGPSPKETSEPFQAVTKIYVPEDVKVAATHLLISDDWQQVTLETGHPAIRLNVQSADVDAIDYAKAMLEPRMGEVQKSPVIVFKHPDAVTVRASGSLRSDRALYVTGMNNVVTLLGLKDQIKQAATRIIGNAESRLINEPQSGQTLAYFTNNDQLRHSLKVLDVPFDLQQTSAGSPVIVTADLDRVAACQSFALNVKMGREI